MAAPCTGPFSTAGSRQSVRESIGRRTKLAQKIGPPFLLLVPFQAWTLKLEERRDRSCTIYFGDQPSSSYWHGDIWGLRHPVLPDCRCEKGLHDLARSDAAAKK